MLPSAISPKTWINASAFMIKYIYGYHSTQLRVVLVTVGVQKDKLGIPVETVFGR